MMGQQNEHYVPVLLLKNFVGQGSEQLFVYDKWKGRRFTTNIHKIAAEKGFNDFEIGGLAFTIEPSLAAIESAASPLIARILREQSIAGLNVDERLVLGLFIAVQLTRTKQMRMVMDDIPQQISARLRAQGDDPSCIPQLANLDENEAKVSAVRMIQQSAAFVPLLCSKIWVLLGTRGDRPLYVSDNPVTMHNDERFDLLGNLGIAVKGIQINLPISSKYSLGLYCTSHTQAIAALYQKYGVAEGGAIPLAPECVTHLNSLQVAFSTRFICSPNEDFGLVDEMLASDPSLRTGIKPRLK